MAISELLHSLLYSVLLGLVVVMAESIIPFERIFRRNTNRNRVFTGDTRSLVERSQEMNISSLRKILSDCQTDLREKDRAIQCQRETIERLEHRHAADTWTIKGQLNFIKIKDSILVSKNRLTKELNDELVESDQHIQNLQWDVQSLKAQVEEKDQLLWVATGSDSCALETICDLKSQLKSTTGYLTLKESDRANLSALERVGTTYAKIMGRLTVERDDAQNLFVKQTADLKECRARIAFDIPHYIECIKVKDVALRNAEAMLKTSEAKCNALLNKEMAKSSRAARDARIVELRSQLSRIDTDLKTSQMDRKVQANDLLSAEEKHDETLKALARRNQAFFKLRQRYDSDIKAAASEREELESQISTLENKVRECRRRVSTVNIKNLNTETRLSSILKEKKELETKLEASTHLAEENSQHLGFARHALDNAITQLKTLHSECNTHKLAKERFESALDASQRSVTEISTSLRAQTANASRYAHQLLKTEERYKESMALSTDLGRKLETFTAQATSLSADLQGMAETRTAQFSGLDEQTNALATLCSESKEQSQNTAALWQQLRAQWALAKAKAAATATRLQKELDFTTQLLAKSEKRAAYFQKNAGSLEASLAAVQENLAKTSRDLVCTRRSCREAQLYAVSHAGALGEANGQISGLETRVAESEKEVEKVSQALRQANDQRADDKVRIDELKAKAAESENLAQLLRQASNAWIGAQDQVSELETGAAESEKACEKLSQQLRLANGGRDELKVRVAESEREVERVSQALGQANNGWVTAVNKLERAMRMVHRLEGQKARVEEALGEESRAREEAEGYVAVDSEGSGSEEEEDEFDEFDEEGDDGDDEEDDEEYEEYESVEVIEGREPVEGEEAFEFVETE